jgi:hypothetical protein
VLTGGAAGLEFGDHGMAGHGGAAGVGLLFAQHGEQVVVGKCVQGQGVQCGPAGVQPGQHRCRVD